MYLCLFLCLGGINRAGAAVPTFLRTPTVIQPHLDMKPFLQFPVETPPPPHSMSLFHNFNTVRVAADNKHKHCSLLSHRLQREKRATQNCKCCAGCWRLPPLCFNLHSSLRTVLNAIVSFKICLKFLGCAATSRLTMYVETHWTVH